MLWFGVCVFFQLDFQEVMRLNLLLHTFLSATGNYDCGRDIDLTVDGGSVFK